MRLSKIKLVGFKSFVDPTVLHLPGNLVGIVGPNGCGKSNIIDAVRWVMGESSARSLRGETMTDVIFNGAATRKPVGLASIELVFDNQQGRLGGPWASYAEIAVKRSVGRDGQSSYFLNGARCRRRDIADIFLGTGLGPRSYAIIEQGMISRLIEAKPEDLRIFLEEAAGVSKYKERRRETETRVRHTRENLERLNDVREELGRQLQHLQRQARAASQYRECRAEERRLKAELLSLRWRALRAELDSHQRDLRQEETGLEAILAEQRQLETRLETGRLRRTELNDAYNEAQGRYYQTGAEISRLEQYVRHQDELRRRREDDRRQTATALARIEAQLAQDRLQQTEWTQALATVEPNLVEARSVEEEADAGLSAAVNALQAGQAAWDRFSHYSGEIEQRAQVEQTRISHLERQLEQGERRLERLRHEQDQLASAELDRQRGDLEGLEPALAEDVQDAQQRLTDIEAELGATREALRQADLDIRLSRERIQAGRGRLTSLHTLQEAALGRDAAEVNEWLQARELAQAPRLAERLEVEPGWETAVETVLSDWLEAICVPDLGALAPAIEERLRGRLTLFEPAVAQRNGRAAAGLAVKVQAPWPLLGLLDGVDTATSLAEALARRARLADDEVLVTPDGLLCGRRWLRLARDEDDGGVLRREREIRRLESELPEAENRLQERSARAEQLQLRLHDELERQRREVQQTINDRQRDHARIQGQLQALRTQWRQARDRCAHLAEERTELEAQGRHDREQLQLARLRLDEAAAARQDGQAERANLLDARERASEAMRQAQAHADAARREVARQAAAGETLRAQLAAVRQALERLDAQRQQLQLQHERQEQADDIAGAAALATAEDDLARCLETQLTVEAELREARQALDAQEAALAEAEQSRGRCEQRAEARRRTIEERRLAWSETRIRQDTLSEQLRELGAEPEPTLLKLEPGAVEADWLERLAQVERRIQRLGPINLAAVEECAQLTERKQFLDAQNADLLDALTALESAVRKIDGETRTRFQDTFERVSTGLGALFPRLFGGGQAHLTLVGDDVLDAGVAIMAKPPGKRIGAISLLSGGEKALTAIALVFAIFQLNPAPFCLLDEVDAPLDETNIGRFGALVQELSARVQFVFVTHNKATMEIARHLAGVTMQEPGVSRLVAVDVEAAVRLAEAGY
ncbi:MAG: chromosome segregation protein SMC [Candidatus Competibacteraceae bacterium]|nr:chromosome segregation protein SMC [Candidatus Competibacteraceae bacterium]